MEDDAATANSIRPRRRSKQEKAPLEEKPMGSWDTFLAEATADLDRYRRRHPSEFEDGP